MVCAADGGSNTGGAVLQQFFNNEQLSHLSEKIDPQTSSGACHLLYGVCKLQTKLSCCTICAVLVCCCISGIFVLPIACSLGHHILYVGFGTLICLSVCKVLLAGLQYYPLLGRGQRFPINDPNLLPHMSANCTHYSPA